jgi:hypothetical protein
LTRGSRPPAPASWTVARQPSFSPSSFFLFNICSFVLEYSWASELVGIWKLLHRK